MAEVFSCALILLAAGASRRMGQPKQLLPVKGQPLLRHMAEIALAGPARPVVVVLGAHAAQISPCLEGLAVEVVVNPDWTEGMGASVRTGMETLAALAPQAKAVIVALADQPDFSSAHLTELIAVHRTEGRTIVASQAGEVIRPPVLFAREWFSHLRAVTGDAGARDLLRENRAAVASVPLRAGIDLDTPSDYERFRRGPD